MDYLSPIEPLSFRCHFAVIVEMVCSGLTRALPELRLLLGKEKITWDLEAVVDTKKSPEPVGGWIAYSIVGLPEVLCLDAVNPQLIEGRGGQHALFVEVFLGDESLGTFSVDCLPRDFH